ncbi:MAG: FAD-dependent oxidoreductase, partial [Thermoproteota archaeon]
VRIIEQKVPVKFVGEGGKLKYMVTVDLTLGPPDSTGRPSPIILPGTEKTFDVDSVIVAIGGKSTPPFKKNKLGIEVSEDGRILVDQKKRTNKVGIFAAGDVESGPSLIGPAVKSGMDAALSIKEFLISKKWK